MIDESGAIVQAGDGHSQRKKGKGQKIRQDQVLPVDGCEGEQGPPQNARRPQHAAGRNDHRRPQRDARRGDLDARIEHAQPGGAGSATSAGGKPTQEWDKVYGPELLPAMGTAGPVPDHAFLARQAEDQNAEEAADERRHDDRQPPRGQQEIQGCCFRRIIGCRASSCFPLPTGGYAASPVAVGATAALKTLTTIMSSARGGKPASRSRVCGQQACLGRFGWWCGWQKVELMSFLSVSTGFRAKTAATAQIVQWIQDLFRARSARMCLQTANLGRGK